MERRGRVDVPFVMRWALRQRGRGERPAGSLSGCPFFSSALVVLERAERLRVRVEAWRSPASRGSIVGATMFGRLLSDSRFRIAACTARPVRLGDRTRVGERSGTCSVLLPKTKAQQTGSRESNRDREPRVTGSAGQQNVSALGETVKRGPC